MPTSTDGGPVSLSRRPVRRRQKYLLSAQKTVRRIRRSVSRRLAAAFGL